MFTENINIGNNRRVVLLTLAFAALGFAVAFVAAPFILQAVNGYSIIDPKYQEYQNPDTGEMADVYTNILINGCIRYQTDSKMILDTNSLTDATDLYDDLLYKDPCQNVALMFERQGWIQKDIEVDGDRTIITLEK